MTLTQEIRDRRVAVAEDVLLQLGRLDVPLRVRLGAAYISGVDHTGSAAYEGLNLDGDLKDQADLVQRNCAVCAVGALLLSKARVLNEVPMADLVYAYPGVEKCFIAVGREGTLRLLEDTFDDDTLNRVEAFFEASPMHISPGHYRRAGMAAYGLSLSGSLSLSAARKRMIEIAENIVRNRGEFIVPAQYAIVDE